MTNDPLKELRDKKKLNDDRIQELAVSINVWMSTASLEQLERVSDIQDYVTYRMLEIEILGQEEKIKQMREVVKILKK